jgi:hypothetical protein
MVARRTTAKLIRFAPEELAGITARAHACGLTPARFIRETALGAIPHARPHRDRDALLRALAHIGAHLERLSGPSMHEAHPDVATQLTAALDAHRAALRQLVRRDSARHAPTAEATPEADG